MNARFDTVRGQGAGAATGTGTGAGTGAGGTTRTTTAPDPATTLTVGDPGRRRWQMLVAFAIVYIVWGSTYLAIRWAIDGLPPLLMAGARHLIAGLFMIGLQRLRGEPRPAASGWRTAAIVGVCLLALGNGCVSYGEQYVTSSTTALLISSVPLLMAVIGAATGAAAWPTRIGWLGLVAGLVGVGWLASAPGAGAGEVARPGHPVLGSALVLAAALGWAAGSVYAKRHRPTASVLMAGGMQMVCGGGAILVAALLHGDAAAVDWAAVPGRSWLAFAYLTVFGSIVAYSAYGWLIQAVTPTLAGTTSFVNPVVAVLLGWWLAGETLSGPVIGSSVLIVGAVMLVVLGSRQAAPRANERP